MNGAGRMGSVKKHGKNARTAHEGENYWKQVNKNNK